MKVHVAAPFSVLFFRFTTVVCQFTSFQKKADWFILISNHLTLVIGACIYESHTTLQQTKKQFLNGLNYIPRLSTKEAGKNDHLPPFSLRKV